MYFHLMGSTKKSYFITYELTLGGKTGGRERGSIAIFIQKKVWFGLKVCLHLNSTELSPWHGPKAGPLGLHVSDPRGCPGRAPGNRP